MNVEHGKINPLEVPLDVSIIYLHRVICPDNFVDECTVTIGNTKIHCIKKGVNKAILFPILEEHAFCEVIPFKTIYIVFFLNKEKDIINYAEKTFVIDLFLDPKFVGDTH